VRNDPTEPLPWEVLVALPIHVLIRDYPELMPILLSRGLSMPESGGLALREALALDLGELEAEVSQALGWRVK
jgi:hypothetical protein